jgi:opacity protein-like surface antigen
MRRKRNLIVAGVCLYLMIAPFALPNILSIKFFGGAGNLPRGGDFKELFESTAQRWKDVGLSGSFDLDYSPWFYEGGIQAVFQLTPNFGLCFGAGYISKIWKQSPHIEYNWGGAATFDSQNKYDVQSIPLTLDAVVTIPFRGFSFNIFGGGGYYLTRVNFTEDSQYSEPSRASQPNWKWHFRSDFASGQKAKLGFQFGAGFEVSLSSRVNIFIEGLYRLVEISSFQGPLTILSSQTWTGGNENDDDEQGNAIMWYETSNISGRIYHYMEAWETKPPWADSAREFKVSLDGISLRLGIRIGI